MKTILKSFSRKKVFQPIWVNLYKIALKGMDIGQGKAESQPIWENLHKTALKGMNIGQGGVIGQSGEQWVMNYIKTKLPDDGIVFDVGANIGNYTLELLSRLGNKIEIYCFEPSGKTFEVLSEKIHGSDNIKAFNFGFGDKEESVTLYSNSKGSGLASVYHRRLDHFGIDMKYSEKIKLKTLDIFCKDQGITHIDFLKIDVEGHELKVLNGAESLVESKAIDFIQFEFGGCNIDSRTYFQDFFYALNPFYKIHRILKNGLFPIENYQETYENFITTNFLAVSRNITEKNEVSDV